jgi:hypothetical protein
MFISLSDSNPIKIFEMQRQLNSSVNLLLRLFETFPTKTRSQNRVTIRDTSARVFEAPGMENFAELKDVLLDINCRSRVPQVIRQHPVLQWRKRICIFEMVGNCVHIDLNWSSILSTPTSLWGAVELATAT